MHSSSNSGIESIKYLSETMGKSIRPLLDKIEKPIAVYLKDAGFAKKGRTFNRETERGVVQVINLQSGSYLIGDYVIPRIRESYYGKFTVNLGVGIEEVWRVGYPNLDMQSFCRIIIVP